MARKAPRARRRRGNMSAMMEGRGVARKRGVAQEASSLHPNAGKITGVICGLRIEDIEHPLMRKIRSMSKLVGELAKGRPRHPARLDRQDGQGGFMIRTGRLCAPLIATAACGPATPPAAPYTPRVRAVTVTTVPLLVKEAQGLYPFLRPAFAKGGVLEGKEVYAFSPSTITVVEGDTLQLTLINPEDDTHSFVLPDFAVALPGGTKTQATYIAKHAGIFPILCSIPSHLPMMSGQLVVLSASSMAGAATR